MLKYDDARACKRAIFSPSLLIPLSLPLLLHSRLTLRMAMTPSQCALTHPSPVLT